MAFIWQEADVWCLFSLMIFSAEFAGALRCLLARPIDVGHHQTANAATNAIEKTFAQSIGGALWVSRRYDLWGYYATLARGARPPRAITGTNRGEA